MMTTFGGRSAAIRPGATNATSDKSKEIKIRITGLFLFWCVDYQCPNKFPADLSPNTTFVAKLESGLGKPQHATGPLNAMKKILVIEDEPEMRRNLSTILKLEKFNVLQAGNGRTGLDIARAEIPDLIVCDVMMPEMDGYAVVQALRQETKTMNIPFIFLTAKGEKADLRSGMNLGADDYLTKPVANAELIRAIETRLRRCRQQAKREFNPDFYSAGPFVKLRQTPAAAETPLWLASGHT